ncbi:Gfo/Idh/MocA family oxidoreductase [Patescibacteria group bacterium]|nr:Gfo/Idh/MocA family oxidoreductase [Patescibacteria group bacterium]
MNKKSKILIVGLGSIGQRHYNNLIKLGYKDITVFDVDEKKITFQQAQDEKRLKDYKTIRRITVSELKKFDVIFICNPNNVHIKTALLCAQAGCHLFIEKPLSHNFNNIDKLIEICQKKKLITMVGCNMRFHPCLKFIKNYLEQGKLGKVYSISHEFGYYLPYWRPKQDYKKNYAAKKATGGGIILDDIHEFDLLFWLNNFADIKQSKFVFDQVSNLKIETEDICLAAFKFKNNVVGSVKCDYLQQNYTRNCKVIGAKGNLEWDFNRNIVWLKSHDSSKKLFAIKNFDFNKVFIDEVKYFFSCLKKKQKTFNDLKTADDVLKICLKR